MADPAPHPAATDHENPWLGLASFTEEQANLFHGRDAEIRDLSRRAERNALTVLFGQSGLGKSSLLQAGVFPRLRAAGYWPIYVRLDHGPGAPTPTEQIKTVVRADTARAGTWTKPGSAQPGESLWEFFHHRDDRLVSAAGRTIVPVLVFDQFEELFTLGAGAGGGAERARAVAFMSELAELVENRPSEKLVARLEESSAEMDAFDFGRTDYRVVITLREDFLPHLESLKTTMPALMENRMRLARMTGTQALDAVVKPGGALVTAEVARAIVEFVAGARGGSEERLAELDVEPPLLSVICRELNERRRALSQPQISADLVSGNRREILNDFYERSLSDLPALMRTFVEDKLLTKSGFRDNLALETALEEPGVTRPLIDTLVARRLLRIEDRIGVQRLELTHDVLAEVIRASRDTRQQRIAADQLRARERVVHRRMWLARGIAAALLVALAGASWLAWRAVQARRTETQRSSRTDLALASRLLDEGKVGEGLAYLVRAARKDPDNTLLGPRLLSTLASQNFLLPDGPPIPLPSPAIYSRASSDGRRIFVQSEDRVLRVISTTDWKLEREFKFASPLQMYGWTIAEKNDRVLAVELENGTLLVCDATTGEPIAPPIKRPNDVRGHWSFDLVLSLSPNGEWLATGDRRSMWIWDTRTGQLVATVPYARHNGAGDYVFSADSRSVHTSINGGSRVYSVPEGKLITEVKADAQIGHSGTSGTAMMSADGRKLTITGARGAQLLALPSGTPIGEIYSGFAGGQHIIFSPDGQTCVISCADGVTRVFDATTGKLRFDLQRHSGPAYKPQFSRDGKTLLTNSADGTVRLWDMETARLLAVPTLQQEQYMPAELAPDGRSVVLFLSRGGVQRFVLGRGAAAPLVLPRTSTNQVPERLMLASSPARLMAIDRARATVVDIASGREVAGEISLPGGLNGAMNTSLRNLNEFEPLTENRRFVARTGAKEWRAWTFDGTKFKSSPPLEDTADLTTPDFSFSPDGTQVIHRATLAADASLPVWNTETGKIAATVRIGRTILSSSYNRFSPDGKRLLLKTDDGAWLWDIAAAKKIFEVHAGGRATELSTCWFSPDATRLLGTDVWGGGYVWDAASGQMLKSFLSHRDTAFVFQFSPDRRLHSTVSFDGSVKVWSNADAAPAGPALGHTARTYSATFSPDGARIATSAVDGVARVWDVQTGQPLTVPLVHGPAGTDVRGATFSPDGRFLKTRHVPPTGVGANAATWVWAVPTARGRMPDWLLHLATMCAGREVTDEGEFRGAESTLARVDELRRALAAEPSDSGYAEWARWLLSSDANRPIAPGFTITPAEARKLTEESGAQDPLPEMTTRDNALLLARNYAESEPLEREMLTHVLKRDGAEGPNADSHLIKLAQSLVMTGKFEEAEKLARESLRLREQRNSRDTYPVQSARGTLGAALAGQKRYAEAEPLLTEAGEFFMRPEYLTGQNDLTRLQIQNRLDSLVELYEATARPEKAAEWKKWSSRVAPPPATKR